MARRSDGAKYEDWRGRLHRFDSSGLTVTEFCQREQVSQASFYYWSKRIRKGGSSKTLSKQPCDGGKETSRSELENDGVEIIVGDSIRVQMPAGEPAAVAALIRHLQDAMHTVDTRAASRFQRIELTR